ncbi:SDR family oxidoreductase [Roseibium sp. SCP14]|uniref:SDR family oxidoreductase n=1 Tax=Roseibium sp. SCP14 TaxID=3141375 RepID=UPI003334FEB6
MKKAVVLGAYGFIGSACVRALQSADYEITAVGRSRITALRTFPDLSWVIENISQCTVERWKAIFQDADVVVNVSGALQDGARDDLVAIHETAVEQILKSLAGSRTRLVQISAAGVSPDAPTDFFRTKARGDALVTASGLDWIVLRPVLVLGSDAYGGTALLRAVAALPAVGAKVFPDAPVQTVHVDDVAKAVVQAAGGELGNRFVADLTENEQHSFHDLTVRIRSWLGFPSWSGMVTIPDSIVSLLGKGADVLGWLGWRSPFRTNALVSLKNGIRGDAAAWNNRGGHPMKSLEETLQHLEATAQERAFARLYLLLPLAIACLSVFWGLSGFIGLMSFEAATAVLTDRGLSSGFAKASVSIGAVVDLMLAVAVMWRPWTRLACLGMIVVSLAYLVGATVWAPSLWADPLGPLVKVFPAMVLSVVVAMLVETR